MAPGGLSFEVTHLDSVGSTNGLLMERARAGAPEGSVVVADHQSAGRGRLGRVWEAPAGSALLASVLLRPVVPAAHLPLAGSLLALAGREACGGVAQVEVGLKWPNDLVVGKDKVAGILAEADPGAPGGPRGSAAVVAGIGINISWPGPPGAGGTSLVAARAAAGLPEAWPQEAPGGPGAPGAPDPAGARRDALLAGLLEALGRRRSLLDTPQGRRRIVAELRSCSATLGQWVRVELLGSPSTPGPRVTRPARPSPGPSAPGGPPGAGVLVGRAVDLSETGELVLESALGLVTVSSGDVFHLRPVPPPPG